MKTLQVVLFREHKGDPLCSAISALTRGQYTHAALLVDDAEFGTILEAFWPRVRLRRLDPEEHKGLDVFHVQGITDSQIDIALGYAHAHIGDPYSVEDLFRFLPFFRRLFGDENEETAASHHFCSMFVFQCLVAAGVPLLSRIEAWCVSPNILSYSPLLIQAT